jgi:hypothetical protein
MRGTMRFARVAGIVALGGAFYTATYITSYPGGAPTYAVLGLLAGTAGGIISLVAPRSVPALTTAAVLLGFAFTGAVIDSGAGFWPGFVLMIIVARRAARPGDFAFLEEPRRPAASSVERLRRRATSRVVVVPDAERVVTVPDAERVVTVPEAAGPEDAPRVSQDGRVQAGPPGIIGVLGPPGRRASGGFR